MIDTSDYEKLKKSVGKLRLNDAAFTFQSETSVALGFGFRCGFLGLLAHGDRSRAASQGIRYRSDFDLSQRGLPGSLDRRGEFEVDNPLELPDVTEVLKIEEPTILARIHAPNNSIGDLLTLVTEKRGVCGDTETIDETRVMMTCHLPLNEILVDFNDRFKERYSWIWFDGLRYERDYVESSLVRMEILVNAEPVDAFSTIVHRDKAETRGRAPAPSSRTFCPASCLKLRCRLR